MRRSRAKTIRKITDCQRDFKKTRQRERGQSHESTFKMKMNTTPTRRGKSILNGPHARRSGSSVGQCWRWVYKTGGYRHRGSPNYPHFCAWTKSSYSNYELRFMYKNGQRHLTLFCIVFVWLRGRPSTFRGPIQDPWFMYQNRLGPSGGIYYCQLILQKTQHTE